MLKKFILFFYVFGHVLNKEEPYFSKFPEDISAVQGTSIILPCEVTPSQDFHYYWELNGIRIRNTTRRYQTGNNLCITRLDRERDSGQFTCIAEDSTRRSASITSSPASINFQWIGNPSVKLHEPISESFVHQGIDIILKCQVDASEDVHIEWFQNTHSIVKSHRLVMKKNKLHIKGVQLSDNGVYRCTAKNIAGKKESLENFKLIIQRNKFMIKTVPSDIFVKKTDTAIFNCAYSEFETIQWYFMNQLLNSNERIKIHSNGSLEINNIIESDEGFYTCTGVSRATEMSQNYSAKLTLAYITPLTTTSFEPALSDSFEMVVGMRSLLQLTCLIPKSLPIAKNWWEDVKNHTVSDTGRIRVDEERMLIIENIQMEDSGKYKCVAANLAGIVEKIVEIIVTDKPKITRDPQSVAVDQGRTSHLTCEYETTFLKHTIVKWRKDGKTFHNELSDKDQRVQIFQQNGTLVIYNTQPFDRGEYNCEVITLGHDPVLSKPASVSVIEQLKFAPPPVNRNIELGSTSRIHCKAQGTPPPIVSWRKGDIEASLTFPSHVIDINGTLQFNGVLSEDNGTYTCIASNSQGIIHASINVDVVVAPKFTIEPQNPTEVEEGNSVSIDCAAEGDPKPKIHWDKDLKMNSFDTSRFQILSNGTLFISKVSKEDEDVYGCTAGNSAGLNRKDVKLIVLSFGKNYTLVDDGNTVTKAVTITMSVASAYIILVVGLTIWCRYRRQPRNSNHEDSKQEDGNINHVELKDSGNCSSTIQTNGQVTDETDAGSSELSNLYDKPNLSRQHLKDVKLIGRGEYGDVMVAKVAKQVLIKSSKNIQINSTSEDKEIPILVKALNQTKDENFVKEFKREMYMFSISHENITKFYGVCTEAEPHYLMLEYTDWGDFKKFLVATKSKNVLPLTNLQSITILHQLSRGMEHLANNKWVHKDLATRNCLVSSTLFAKISLPKLTRDPYSQEYCKHINQVIPVRWLPYEAVYEDDYSTKTDVYSFAVLIWEIFSQGELPHSNINDNSFLMKLKQQTLEWKSHPSTPEQLIKLQELCWNKDSNERPLFDTISTELSNILTSV